MSRKKIAILAAYVGLSDRGTETFVIELTKYLGLEYDITVFSLGTHDEIKDNIKIVSPDFSFFFNVLKKLYWKLKLFRKICDKTYYLIPSEIEQYYFSKKVYKNYLLREKYDLIFPNNGIHGAKFAEKIRKRYSTPFIYTGHGGTGRGEKLILGCKPDMYIALTEYNKKFAEKYHDKVTKIYMGAKAEKSDNIILKSDFPYSRPVVLCVAAFTAFKRQKLLIDAMALLNYGYLILLGDGEMYKDLEKYCELRIPGRHLIKKVGKNDVAGFYKLCDVFSLPSENEPFGIVYVEAMAFNKPVVAPLDQNREEIIGEAGILCNVENPKEYANAIKNCFHNDWSDIPVKRFKNNFSWDKIAGDYKSVIEHIISSD